MLQRVLVVDGNPDFREILSALLADEFDVVAVKDGQSCLTEIDRFVPDVVLLDILMPGIDGFETCRRVKETCACRPQVIMVSARALAEERVRAYDADADDYLVKPIDHNELFTKLRMHGKLRQALDNLLHDNAEVKKQSVELQRLVVERSRDVQATQDVAVFAMAKLADSRDPETGDHLQRMRNYSVALAEQLRRDGQFVDEIDDVFIDDLFRSSPLHDIGKIGVSEITASQRKCASEAADRTRSIRAHASG